MRTRDHNKINNNNNNNSNNNNNRWNRDQHQGNFVSNFGNMSMNDDYYYSNNNNNNRWNQDQGNFVNAFGNMSMNNDFDFNDLALATNDYASDQSEWFIDSAASKPQGFTDNGKIDAAAKIRYG